MYNYPFWGFPGFRRNYYRVPNYYKSNNYIPSSTVIKSPNNLNNSNNIYNNYSTNFNDTINNKIINNKSEYNKKEENIIFSYIQDSDKKTDFSSNDNYYSDNESFNIFGLNVHIDDLLILALIFFLYKEGTDDIYLYIALFLLLLS